LILHFGALDDVMTPLSPLKMRNTFIIFICILPPPMEIYKVFKPYFGINFEILRLLDSLIPDDSDCHQDVESKRCNAYEKLLQ
jgi:hypothetical protein